MAKQLKDFSSKYGIPCAQAGEIKDFIVCLNEESDSPDEDELIILRSYQEFKIRHCCLVAEKILRMKLPQIKGFNTVILLRLEKSRTLGNKLRNNGWCYRKLDWEAIAPYSPAQAENPPALTLAELLDQIESSNIAWAKWKLENVDIFFPN